MWRWEKSVLQTIPPFNKEWVGLQSDTMYVELLLLAASMASCQKGPVTARFEEVLKMKWTW